MEPMEGGHQHGEQGGAGTLSRTKLMVKYVPEQMGREGLHSTFASCGPIASCKLVANRGYGFVEYQRREDAERAKATFDGLALHGKNLKVSFALLNPPEGRQQQQQQQQSSAAAQAQNSADRNLYISNLAADVTLDQIKAAFARCGTIVNSRVAQGIAFVCFETRAQAEDAIARLNGQPPAAGKAPMTVKFANRPAARQQPPPANGHHHHQQHQHNHHQPQHNGYHNGHHHHQQHQPMPAMAAPPFAAPPYNGELAAMARFGFPQAVGGALLPPPMPPGGKTMAFINKGHQRFNPMAAPNHASAVPMPPPPQLAHLAEGQMPPPPSSSLSAHRSTVYVYNVGDDIDELTLWQLFGPYGAIESIKVIKDQETKKNRGFAFVNMRDHDEAALAIRSLNGFAVNGQVLSVNFKTQKVAK